VLEWVLTVGVCWLCFAGVWAAPASGATLVYPDGLVAADVLVAVALAILMLTGHARPVARYPFLWPCALVLGVSALSACARAMQPWGDPSWLRLWQDGEPMARGLLLFLAVSAYPRLLRVAFGAALLGLTVVAGAGIIQHLQGCSRWYVDLDGGWASGFKREASTPRVQGLTSYINLTAAFMAGTAPMWYALTAMRATQRRWVRGLCIAGAACAMLTLWYTSSRGPIFAIQVVALLLAWRLYPRARWHVLAALMAFTLVSRWSQIAELSPPLAPLAALIGPVSLVALAAGVGFGIAGWRRDWRWIPLAVALAFVGGTQSFDLYVLHQPIASRDVMDPSRMAMYTEVARMVPLHPWTGVGDDVLGQYIVQHGRLIEVKLNALPATQRNTHNQPLQWAAAQGVPVAVLYLALVIGVAYWLWRRSHGWPPGFPRAVVLASAVGLLGFLLCNFAEAHFWRMEGSGFFWTLAALGAAVAPPAANTGDPSESLGETRSDMV
jgi:hypothetical protein